jgi:hypothetical protein
MRGVRSGRAGRRAQALVLGLGLGLTAAHAEAQSTVPVKKVADPPAARPPLAESLSGLAKAEYGAGVSFFQQGDYASATERFERVYALSPDPRLLWNVALCQKNQRRYARMLGTLRRVVKEGTFTAKELTELEELSQAAEALVSRLEILASEVGATVLVDDEPMGLTPLQEPILVDLGERRIRLVKPGFKGFARTEKVSGGGRIAIAVALEKVTHRGQLVVVTGPNDLVSLDGKVVGRGGWKGSVPSGQHALRVTAPGKLAHEVEVLVQDGEARHVDVTLNPAKRSSTMTWAWIGGGVALLAGAVLAGALLYEPGPPAEQGSLGSLPLSFGSKGWMR